MSVVVLGHHRGFEQKKTKKSPFWHYMYSTSAHFAHMITLFLFFKRRGCRYQRWVRCQLCPSCLVRNNTIRRRCCRRRRLGWWQRNNDDTAANDIFTRCTYSITHISPHKITHSDTDGSTHENTDPITDILSDGKTYISSIKQTYNFASLGITNIINTKLYHQQISQRRSKE